MVRETRLCLSGSPESPAAMTFLFGIQALKTLPTRSLSLLPHAMKGGSSLSVGHA